MSARDLSRRGGVATLLAALALLTTGCGRDSAAAASPAATLAVATPARAPSREVSFIREVQPIFSKRCIACHVPGAYEDGSAMGGLVLSEGKSVAQLVGHKSIESKLPRVAPGDLNQSYLYHKLRGSFAQVGGTGVKMPLGGSMPEEEIAIIEDWILGGAKID